MREKVRHVISQTCTICFLQTTGSGVLGVTGYRFICLVNNEQRGENKHVGL